MTRSIDAGGNGRWLAFATLCFGDLMIVLDSTIVNVALPSIRTSLEASEASLVWVVNAYLLTFGGFLLLGGRLADLYGAKRLFVIGLAAFTVASLLCGAAPNLEALVAARALQGIAGAVVSAVALSLIMRLFEEGPDRVRAMGYFGFIMAGGGSVGLLLGGVITDFLNWRWNFLVNLPVGVVVLVLALRLLPSDQSPATRPKLDFAGAGMITLALMLAVYGVVNTEQAGWLAASTLWPIGAAVALIAAFLVWESRIAEPLVPLDLFRLRNHSVANVVGVLWAAAMFAWFFLTALYLQLVLGYEPLGVGLAFLPSNLIMAAFSWSLSAKLVTRFGIRAPLAGGLALAAAGLALLALAPVEGEFWLHILPPMLLLGTGAGMAFNPVLLAAMNDVGPDRAGLASGVVNTAFMMGGALGLAVLVSVAASVTAGARAEGASLPVALTSGYQSAFWIGAASAALASALAATLLRTRPVDAAAVAAAH